MKSVAAVLLCACLPALALADAAPEAQQAGQTMEVEHYNYGMDLDIKHVISIKRTNNLGSMCGVTPVDMVYEDSHGQRHDMEYLSVVSGCGNG